MITPFQVATRGYFNSPFAVAHQGYLYLATTPAVDPIPARRSGFGGGGGTFYDSPFRGEVRLEQVQTQAHREDDEILAILIAMALSETFK